MSIDDLPSRTSERGFIESNSIALLSNYRRSRLTATRPAGSGVPHLVSLFADQACGTSNVSKTTMSQHFSIVSRTYSRSDPQTRRILGRSFRAKLPTARTSLSRGAGRSLAMIARSSSSDRSSALRTCLSSVTAIAALRRAGSQISFAAQHQFSLPLRAQSMTWRAIEKETAPGKPGPLHQAPLLRAALSNA